MKKLLYTFIVTLLLISVHKPLHAQNVDLSLKELDDYPYIQGLDRALPQANSVYKFMLDVNGNKELPADLVKLENLHLIVLQGNTRRLDWSKTSAMLKTFKKLKFIYVTDSSLTKLPAELFTLTQISGLGIMGTKVDSIPPAIGNLSNLQYLYLDQNQIKKLPADIGKLKKLKVLLLDNNQISVFPPQMAALQQLEEIGIGGNNFSAEELKKLKKMLPKATQKDYTLPFTEY